MAITIMGINAGVIRQDKNFIALALKIKAPRSKESLFFLPTLVLKDLLIALEFRISQIPTLSADDRSHYEKLRDKAVQKMHQNIPTISREELEHADVNMRVNTLALLQHDANTMTFALNLQSGKTVELTVDLLQIELLITVMIHAINNADMRELAVRMSSILDFLPLYDVDYRDGSNLEYDSYDHPAWKRNLFVHHLAVLYRYTDADSKVQFCGTVIKTRSKPGTKEVEGISRRLLDVSPRLNKLANMPSQVLVRALSSDKNKTFSADACMQALYQLQQNAEKAKA
ncbi:YjeJ family protein [Kluyvera intermedia]|uniref:YjeJ family protein n=1 Tax=Kluyvera intermedia TaxID=61648 RepID=UPI00242A6EE0|nr:YjeJ family protein [Kluyvera intermedia]WEJ83105.1 MAG: YjeJ family protein [Kluyvera intermedia]